MSEICEIKHKATNHSAASVEYLLLCAAASSYHQDHKLTGPVHSHQQLDYCIKQRKSRVKFKSSHKSTLWLHGRLWNKKSRKQIAQKSRPEFKNVTNNNHRFTAIIQATRVSRHLQLRTGGFCWCKLLLLAAPHHAVFYRPDALPAAQPRASKHWRHPMPTDMELKLGGGQWSISAGSQMPRTNAVHELS